RSPARIAQQPLVPKHRRCPASVDARLRKSDASKGVARQALDRLHTHCAIEADLAAADGLTLVPTTGTRRVAEHGRGNGLAREVPSAHYVLSSMHISPIRSAPYDLSL